MAKIKVDEGEVGVLQGAADLASSSAESLNGPIEQLKSEAYKELEFLIAVKLEYDIRFL